MALNQILYPCNTPYHQLQVASVTVGDGKILSNIGIGLNAVTGPAVSPATTAFNGTSNIFIGNSDRKNTTVAATDNLAIGEKALNSITTGDSNSAHGSSALASLTTGSKNIAVGYSALTALTTASDNIAVGWGAAEALTTGTRNVAIGQTALAAAITVNDNTAVGYQSLLLATGGTNTAVGSSAGAAVTTGTDNTFIGSTTNTTVATGAGMIAIGAGASCTVTNTAQIGAGALTNVRFGTVAGQVSLGTGLIPMGALYTSKPLISQRLTTVLPAGPTTLTAAQIYQGIITCDPLAAVGTVTLPTSANIIAAMGNPDFTTAPGASFSLTFVNNSTGTLTWVLGASMVNGMQPAALAAQLTLTTRTYHFVLTGAAAITIYG